jgi:hypothetical protein
MNMPERKKRKAPPDSQRWGLEQGQYLFLFYVLQVPPPNSFVT